MRDDLLYNVVNIDETPYGIIKVNSNSNYFYLKTPDSSFVVYEFISNIEIDPIKKTAKYTKEYYNVLNGDIVLTTNSVYDIDGNILYSDEVNGNLISLSTILNVKNNDYYLLYISDIIKIVDFKEEKPKTPRKYYF